MALMIQSSNRVERLQLNLSMQLADQPLSNPMVPEVIVVPTFAMSRWLNLRIAQQQGIAANIQYPLPAAWLWQTAASLIQGLPEQDPLRTESMTWKIFSALPDLVHEPDFDQIRLYLIDDDSQVKRWQLSSRIAEVFDRYQQYRPQFIRDWSITGDNSWQAVIWRAIVSDLDGRHRVNMLSQLMTLINQSALSNKLPERISLFAISSLPPLTLEVIHGLAKHTDITLYQHSPTDQYFADLKSAKSLSRLQLTDPYQAQYSDTGNELLASWGRQGQVMQELLLEQGASQNEENEFNHPPGNTTLLQSIQQSIFDLGESAINRKADDSLSIHICHSAMRECQILHNHLLKMLSDNPALSNEDILIMVPEISRYAPYIESVFGHEGNSDRPYIPWNLSDISIADEHPLVQSFLQLLALPDSRFEYSEIMSLLEVGEIRKRFDIDQQALEDIQQWIEFSRVRWGIDADFKANLGLPATIENTWQQAQQRLFAGYALGEVEYWNDIAPLSQTDSTQAVNIGKFCRLFERLEFWRIQLGKTVDAKAWIVKLNNLLDDFFQAIDLREDRIQPIRDAIDDLVLAQGCAITPALLGDWLEKQLSMQQRQGRLFSGGVTFCGMRPMRNLPFQVICLLGMNDNQFPRRERTCDFDLMNQHWQLGDPRTADEDRYLMLETLLCARHTLYISYTGRSLKDNSECQPSVLVQEILDFIDNQFEYDSENQNLSQNLIHLHPMQPFSEINFKEPKFSYDTGWCDISRQLNHDETPIVDERQWPQNIPTIEESPGEDIDLEQLHRFFRHPIKYYFNSRLKLFLTDEDESINDESFSLDPLSAWEIKMRLADDLLKGQYDQEKILSAEGLLPHGPAASIELDGLQNQQRDWFERLTDFSHIEKQSKIIHLMLEDRRLLFGEVEHYFPGRGLMHYSASKLKGSHLLAIWLDHLSLCACGIFTETDSTTLITGDQIIKFKSVATLQAVSYLLDYVDLFELGQNYILPIFPDSSYAFALGTDPEEASQKAGKAWYQSSQYSVRGDSLDGYIQLALRGALLDPVNHPAFAEYASRIYTPLLQNIGKL